jgi:hypothetical protein
MSKPTAKRPGSARGASPKIRLEDAGRGMSSQAGLVPVVKFLDALGFGGLFGHHVEHTRAANALYQLGDAAFLVVVGLIGGARSLSQCMALWSDEVLRRVAGWQRLPDQSTLGRVFKEVRERHVSGLETLVHALRQRVWARALRAGRSHLATQCQKWIDADSTVKTVYGRQQGTAKGYNPHKRGARSYHPLLAFCSDTKEIVQAWLRTGSAYTSNGMVAFIQQLLGQQRWTPIHRRRGWEQCEFSHRAGGWSRERFFLAVRCPQARDADHPQGELLELECYDCFCYVSTEPLSPWLAHRTYGQRATSETWIEEAKSQMGLAHLKTVHFLANAALFQCAVLAYNTLRWMALLSGNAQLKRWEPQSIRLFLIRVAGKLLTGANQLRIKLARQHLHARVWEDWLALSQPL